MSDATKNLPWRVEKREHALGTAWDVLDSRGNFIRGFETEALARMVAAGSVAGELYAALLHLDATACRPGDDGKFDDSYDDAKTKTRAALAQSAPFCGPKETP